MPVPSGLPTPAPLPESDLTAGANDIGAGTPHADTPGQHAETLGTTTDSRTNGIILDSNPTAAQTGTFAAVDGTTAQPGEQTSPAPNGSNNAVALASNTGTTSDGGGSDGIDAGSGMDDLLPDHVDDGVSPL
jgi:hypothetical protein